MTKDGWIEWNGGECPLDYGTPHDLRYRDGQTIRKDGDNESSFWPSVWRHEGNLFDIIAYREVKPA